MEAVLWIDRTGAPWRDLPSLFGRWNSVYQRFRRWSKKGLFRQLLQVLSTEGGGRARGANGRYACAGPSAWHRCVKKNGRPSIGRSKGGATTNALMLVEGAGRLVKITLLPGNRHELNGVEELLDGVSVQTLIADRAYDCDRLRTDLQARGIGVVIPPRNNRRAPAECDYRAYRKRHVVENFFCRLKQFRRAATRYEKTDESFLAMLYLAALRWAVA